MLHQSGRLEQAAQRYQTILSADPGDFNSLHFFGVLRAQQGKFPEAVNLLRRAIDRNPNSAGAHNDLGMTLNLAERHREAVAPLERAIALAPGHAVAHNNLGIALAASGRHRAAVTCFERAVALMPDYVEALSNLGSALQVLGRNEDAIPLLEKALALNPRFGSAHLNLGVVMRALGRPEEARACFDRVLAADPRSISAYAQLGGMQLEMGRFAEARHCYEQALEHQPRDARILFSIVQCGKMIAGDPQMTVLESLAENPAGLPESQRISLHFALGKAYADLGQDDRSFGHYVEGNACKRRQIVYDEATDLALFDRIRAVFSAELMQTKEGLGHPSDQPIFVLGMMRSGSTLVEQILASHPDMFAAGERRDLDEAYRAVRRTLNLPGRFPETIRLFGSEPFRQIGDSYLDRLVKATGGQPSARITDKMPGNFSSIGLIHLALPKARIIHTIRDPIDTCLSCFSKLFSDNQPFTYDLGELGRYYRAYQTLMQHWHSVLPEGTILDVRYEDLVADLEGQARRIVAYCGLEWDDACLSFHETDRPVRTASQVQVRQPLYRTSVGRWRPAPETLRPLLEGLGIDPTGIAGNSEVKRRDRHAGTGER